MNRQILNNALVAMGYRNMDNHVVEGNFFGKPIGFGLVIAHIEKDHKTMIFKSMFKRYKDGETTCWAESKMDILVPINEKTGVEIDISNGELFNLYVKRIAYAEYECHAEKIVENFGISDTFAFVTKMDYMSMIKI